MNLNTLKRYLLIEKALYNPRAIAIKLAGDKYPIKVNKNHQRYITWNKETIIQESSQRNTKYGKMRRQGNKVTWILRPGKPWGLIINGELKRP